MCSLLHGQLVYLIHILICSTRMEEVLNFLFLLTYCAVMCSPSLGNGWYCTPVPLGWEDMMLYCQEHFLFSLLLLLFCSKNCLDCLVFSSLISLCTDCWWLCCLHSSQRGPILIQIFVRIWDSSFVSFPQVFPGWVCWDLPFCHVVCIHLCFVWVPRYSCPYTQCPPSHH